MYLIDFFRKVTRKSNIPVFIYLVLNVFVIGGVIQVFFNSSTQPQPFLTSLSYGLILYIVSLAIALSPLGEWILRLQTGCKKIKRVEQLNYIEPIFNEVYEKAKKLDSSIPNDVQLFINDDPSPNAFATGRKTICLTKGMLNMPADQIKATLGHEMGHLAHKDTDLILVVTIGNFIVTGLITFMKLIILILQFACEEISGDRMATVVSGLLTTVFINAIMWVWTKVGTVLVMKSSRSNEFEADEFSFNLGYGDSLCALLEQFDDNASKGLFATLASTHPDKDARIARLQELGAEYVLDQGVKNIDENNQYESVIEQTTSQEVELSSDESEKNIVVCDECGAEVPIDSNFCPKCGKQIEKKKELRCPHCGQIIDEEDSVYCTECGSKLN